MRKKIQSRRQRIGLGVLAAPLQPRLLFDYGDLRADPLPDHRRAPEGQARDPRRSDRAAGRQGVPAQEAHRAAQGEEGVRVRLEGGRGLCRGQGHRGAGGLQGHRCQRQDLGEGPEAARGGPEEAEDERLSIRGSVREGQRHRHQQDQGLRCGGQDPAQGRQGPEARSEGGRGGR